MSGLYSFLNRAGGVAECTVGGGMTAAFLNRCASAGVHVFSAQWREPGLLSLALRLRDLDRAQATAAGCGCTLQLTRSSGVPVLWKALLRRAVPVLGLLCVLFLLAWSKLFIWEMDVSGNESVSSARILNALAECGIRPGSFWPSFTSDNLRSELLLKLPELAWATVNIDGSRAHVIVRERVPKPQIYQANEPTDLTAQRVGFVTEVRALNGTARVAPGSAVMPGDILIEGVARSAFSGEREVHALGTVTAETYYERSALIPSEMRVRENVRSSGTLWAVEFGSKRMNFYRNSSICSAGCDKIEKVWELEIKGLFSLPVRLIRIRRCEYELAPCVRELKPVRLALEQQLRARLLADIGTEGSILSEHFSCTLADGTICVCLRARCSEEISAEHKRIQEGYQ